MSVCLFDIDGTLIASGGAGKAALEEALEEVFGIPAVTDKLSFSGRTDRAIIRDLFAMPVIPETPESLQHLRSLKRRPAGGVGAGGCGRKRYLPAGLTPFGGLVDVSARRSPRGPVPQRHRAWEQPPGPLLRLAAAPRS